MVSASIDGQFEVVGAQAALRFFGSSSPERLSHGYLFSGEAGVGKRTFARRLAQSLLCETPKATLLGYCNQCPGCALFLAKTHPDYVEAEGAIKIGEQHPGAGRQSDGDEWTARDLVRTLGLHGYRSAWRVVVLADVELASAAANALLKFFEEPPAGVVVILTTAAAEALPATIRSRLIELVFAPLSAADIAAVLERDGVTPPEAERAARLAAGSINRARNALAGEGRELRDAGLEWFCDALAGKIPDSRFLRLDDRGLSGAEKRASVALLVGLVRSIARDWAALALAGSETPLLNADWRERIRALPSRSPAAIGRVLASLADAERLSATNVTPLLVLDYVRLQLAPVGRQ